jgi:hypothetical protein
MINNANTGNAQVPMRTDTFYRQEANPQRIVAASAGHARASLTRPRDDTSQRGAVLLHAQITRRRIDWDAALDADMNIPPNIQSGRSVYHDRYGTPHAPQGKISQTETVARTSRVLELATDLTPRLPWADVFSDYFNVMVDNGRTSVLVAPNPQFHDMDGDVAFNQTVLEETRRFFVALTKSETFQGLLNRAIADGRLGNTSRNRWTVHVMLPDAAQGRHDAGAGRFKVDLRQLTLSIPGPASNWDATQYHLSERGHVVSATPRRIILRNYIEMLTGEIPPSPGPWLREGRLDLQTLRTLGLGERGTLDYLAERIMREIEQPMSALLSHLPFGAAHGSLITMPAANQRGNTGNTTFQWNHATTQAINDSEGTAALETYAVLQNTYLDALFPPSLPSTTSTQAPEIQISLQGPMPIMPPPALPHLPTRTPMIPPAPVTPIPTLAPMSSSPPSTSKLTLASMSPPPPLTPMTTLAPVSPPPPSTSMPTLVSMSPLPPSTSMPVLAPLIPTNRSVAAASESRFRNEIDRKANMKAARVAKASLPLDLLIKEGFLPKKGGIGRIPSVQAANRMLKPATDLSIDPLWESDFDQRFRMRMDNVRTTDFAWVAPRLHMKDGKATFEQTIAPRVRDLFLSLYRNSETFCRLTNYARNQTIRLSGTWTLHVVLPSRLEGNQAAVFDTPFTVDYSTKLAYIPVDSVENIRGHYYISTSGQVVAQQTRRIITEHFVRILTNAEPRAITHDASAIIDLSRLDRTTLRESNNIDYLVDRIIAEMAADDRPEWRLPPRLSSILLDESQVIPTAADGAAADSNRGTLNAAAAQAVENAGGLVELEVYWRARTEYLDAWYPRQRAIPPVEASAVRRKRPADAGTEATDMSARRQQLDNSEKE